MKKIIYYTFEDESLDYYSDYAINYTDYGYEVEEKLQDIIEYEYEKKFHKQYIHSMSRVDKEMKQFIKELETLWFNNQIDTVTLYNDYKFMDWLKEKYYDKALAEVVKSCIEEDTKSVMSCYNAYNYGYEV